MVASIDGKATILAIGTANPLQCVYQADFPEFYLRLANCHNMPDLLKNKFKRICDKTMIEKHYFWLTEETLKENPELCAYKAFPPLGIHDWNSIFWTTHPGGPAILDQVEAKLGLDKHKLKATRQVLNDYGNMSSASVLFVLDEMRKKSLEEGQTTMGKGLDWGVLFGFGPGITVETLVLSSVPNKR